MITNICLLLEALSVIYCIHCLYGEKIKFDIATTSYLAIYMIIMSAINYYSLSQSYTFIIYPIMFLYCGIRFGFYLKELIVKNFLCVVIVGGIQFIILMTFCWVFNTHWVDDIKMLVVDSIALACVILISTKFNISNLSTYLINKGKIFALSLLFCFAVLALLLGIYKIIELVELYQYALLLFAVVLVCGLTIQLGKVRLKANEIETELRMHELYANSFYGLIDNIRRRQHEFDNHINVIYSQHYMHKNYEDLVRAQKNYCETIVQENRYNKLLAAGNSLIIGFLYGKFMEAERLGIEIVYEVNIKEFNVGVPIYKIIEILGNLINNAIEEFAVSEDEKIMAVRIIEVDENFEIEIMNTSKIINFDDIERFFKKGFSRKGEERGLGLYSIKCICDEYLLNIACENRMEYGKNWICFIVNNKKGTVNI